MKATGSVRRVDDLGRIVIPKEIRRMLRIKEGDPLELYTDHQGQLIFRKYSPMGDIHEFAEQMCQAISKSTGRNAIVTDREAVIAQAGGAAKIVNLPLHSELLGLLNSKKDYRLKAGTNFVHVVEAYLEYRVGVAALIVVNHETVGSVILLAENGKPYSDADLALAQTAAGFLSKQMDY